MKVQVTILRRDLLAMQFLTIFKLKSNYLWFAFMLLAMGLGARKAIEPMGWIPWLLMIAGLTIAWCLIVFTVMVVLIALSASEKKGTIGPTTYVLGDEFFEETTLGTETKTRWEAIEAIYRFKHIILVRINGYRVHLVPKREFASDAEFEAFYQFISEKVAAA